MLTQKQRDVNQPWPYNWAVNKGRFERIFWQPERRKGLNEF